MANFKFIVNPVAARGRCSEAAQIVEEICRQREMDFDIVYTDRPKQAIELAAQARNNFECVVAVGGDGTINEVMNGLVGGKTSLGIVPVGTGNDLIRAIPVPVNIEEAIDCLIAFQTKKIDIGKAWNRYFCNGLGIGFDAWVVKSTLSVKKLRGTAIYLYSVLKTIRTYEPPLVRLRYNDVDRSERFYLITVGNGISLGGGFKLTPMAVIDDGLFDLTIIRDLKKREVIHNLVSVFSGKHIYLEQVTTDRTTALTLESEPGFAAHADGELLSLNIHSMKVQILPGAIDVVVKA